LIYLLEEHFFNDEPPKEDKGSIPKQGEISMAESPEMPPRYSAIDSEPQIPQTSKEEETHPLNHSFNFEAKLSDNPASFRNAHKRPSKKYCLNPLKKRSLQKPPKNSIILCLKFSSSTLGKT
jgi:hypothetical protein